MVSARPSRPSSTSSTWPTRDWSININLIVANTVRDLDDLESVGRRSGAATGLAAAVDRSNPLAVNANVLAVLLAGGKAPAALRNSWT